MSRQRRFKLRYTRDSEPGIKRIRAGKGFRYARADGRSVKDKATLERIRGLVIPPAYRKVWICRFPDGHLQATGYDDRERKQYRYHAEWRRLRDEDKFARMTDFAQALPALRRKVRADLASPGLNRDKVLALLVSLLDRTGMRIGNEEYARDNGTYGLTTLLDRHAKVAAGRLALRFAGKGGKWHDLEVNDKNLAAIVRRCQQLRGQDLFQYLDDDGRRRPVDSGMVNDYLQSTMRDTFTAKDFRGWYATVSAVRLLAARPVPEQDREVDASLVEVVSCVAAELRHTAAVCRKSYINPAVLDAWRCGVLQRLTSRYPCRTKGQRERLTLKVLVKAR